MWREPLNFWSNLFREPKVEEVRQSVEDKTTTPTPHYVFIHGANQTRRSWNYILSKLEPTSYTLLEYNTNIKFEDNLEELHNNIRHLENIFFVGHSLGGLYSLHLYDRMADVTLGGVTLSTPYGGSKTADYVKYMVPSYSLFREIGPRSIPITLGKLINIKVPWRQVVTTSGSVPWHGKDNDGVVTTESMMSRDDIKYTQISVNHYEILAIDETVEIIKQEVRCLKF